MLYTTNYGLQKPEPLINNVDIEVLNENMNIVDKGLVVFLGTTSGSANAYTITTDILKALSEGLAICIKIHSASNAACSLNINGWGAKAIKKAGGADVANLKVGMYTLRYDGLNFILQGEGASGNATASDLLLDKTATTDAGEITGTIPINGPAVSETINLTSEGAEYIIPYGHHSGLRKIKTVITNLLASVIKAGVTVGGILGTFTADATATAAQILTGATAYVNGVKVTGTIVNKGGTTTTAPTAAATGPSTGYIDVTVPANAYYDTAAKLRIYDVDAVNTNILAGKDIFGIPGAIPNKTGAYVNPTNYYPSGTSLIQAIPDGYYDNATARVQVDDPDFVAANILATKNIFGVQGAIPVFNAGPTSASSPSADGAGGISMIPQTGYHQGYAIYANDPDFIASNIVGGVNIFGLTGTGKRTATGSVTSSTAQVNFTGRNGAATSRVTVTVSGLTFKPSRIIVFCNSTSSNFIFTVYTYNPAESRNIIACGFTPYVLGAGDQIDMFDDVANVSVTTTGFTLPFYAQNLACTWFAYE